MPIKIPNELPARTTLDSEGVMVMREADAVRQDIRPMRIGLLNLMPNKIKTETQIARLLGSTPLQVELTLVKMTNHIARNTPSDHIISFYRDAGNFTSALEYAQHLAQLFPDDRRISNLIDALKRQMESAPR